MIRVSVPATSANVGAGFDAVGLALGLYNTAEFFPAEKLEITSSDGTAVPADETNLIYVSAKYLYDKAGEPIPGMKIVQTNPIPMARGLGSSSACILAGLLGANRMLGEPFGTAELLEFATEIEGHPDNVAPALLGGLVSSVCDGGKVYAAKHALDQSLAFAAVIPDYPLLTSAARAALPKNVSHAQAVFNLSRAALLGEAFCNGRHDLLPVVTQDRLHQQYRMALMPGAEQAFAAARRLGAKAVYVSGAGSTMMAVVEQADAYAFCRQLKAELAESEACRSFTLKRLSADNRGAFVE
ncbi:MAG: homoserine kinase [Faecalibacterium sp.]|jgi:homoserine kinase|nr:homoserine kinase [Faecalibacterium sp.]